MVIRKSLLALGIAFAAGSANAVVIDTFDDTSPAPFSHTATNGSPVTNQASTSGSAIGGTRLVSATADGDNINVQIDGSAPNVYSHSATSNVRGTSTVVWGGPTGAGFTATDLTAMNHNGIRVYVNDSDENTSGNSLTMTVNGSSATYNFPANASGSYYIDFPFAALGVSGTGVTQIQMMINGGVSDDWDVDIDDIQTVCTSRTTVGPAADGDCAPPPTQEVPVMGALGYGLMALLLPLVAGFRRFKK